MSRENYNLGKKVGYKSAREEEQEIERREFVAKVIAYFAGAATVAVPYAASFFSKKPREVHEEKLNWTQIPYRGIYDGAFRIATEDERIFLYQRTEDGKEQEFELTHMEATATFFHWGKEIKIKKEGERIFYAIL